MSLHCKIIFIGVETARALAVKGAHVVMLCRNVSATEIVKDNILNERVKFVIVRSRLSFTQFNFLV